MTGRPAGRPAAASRDEVLAGARAQFRGLERIDITGLATALSLSRATIHRWYGSREGLLDHVLRAEFDDALTQARAGAEGVGGERVLATLDLLQRMVRADPGLQRLLQREGAQSLRILTGDGPFQRHVVDAVRALVEAAIDEGYEPPLPVGSLAYSLVRLAEAFIYHDSAVGAYSDLDRLLQVERVLLALPPVH